MNRILILLASLLVVGESFALPPCPTSGVWNNCSGTRTYGDGDKYVGEWKDGERYRGTFTFGEGEFEGEKFVGEFKDEEWWNGTVYDSEGNVVDTWSEGVPE